MEVWVNDAPVPVISAILPSGIKSKKQVIQSGATSPASLAAMQAFTGIVVKAGYSNAEIIWVGGPDMLLDGTNGYPLKAGEAISYVVADASAIYITGSANDLIYYTGN